MRRYTWDARFPFNLSVPGLVSEGVHFVSTLILSRVLPPVLDDDGQAPSAGTSSSAPSRLRLYERLHGGRTRRSTFGILDRLVFTPPYVQTVHV